MGEGAGILLLEELDHAKVHPSSIACFDDQDEYFMIFNLKIHIGLEFVHMGPKVWQSRLLIMNLMGHNMDKSFPSNLGYNIQGSQ